MFFKKYYVNAWIDNILFNLNNPASTCNDSIQQVAKKKTLKLNKQAATQRQYEISLTVSQV